MRDVTVLTNQPNVIQKLNLRKRFSSGQSEELTVFLPALPPAMPPSRQPRDELAPSHAILSTERVG
jgi:hypothetical protein